MDTILRLQVSDFDAPHIRHGFYGRPGGVSDGIYTGLNIGFGSKDAPAHVAENRTRIATDIGVSPDKLLNVYQVHGDTCTTVLHPWPEDEKPESDAMVTDKAGVAIGVLTADCTPVLFHGEKSDGSPVIGAAHAGWRGALAGVLQSTVSALNDLGAQTETIKAAIGPCIQKKSYEVSQEFCEQFMAHDPENERFFSAGQREGHPHFDLPGYCASTLAGAGVRTIFIEGRDTYSENENFFSCRRAAHNDEPDYGRQMSVIAIAPPATVLESKT